MNIIITIYKETPPDEVEAEKFVQIKCRNNENSKNKECHQCGLLLQIKENENEKNLKDLVIISIMIKNIIELLEQ